MTTNESIELQTREGTDTDPTHNVQRLTQLSVKRIDDLALAESRRVSELFAAESRRVNEQMSLRAEYAAQLNLAEAKRIDAIRAVDVNAVSVANEKATAQAVVLASQVAASAETLRALVATTAATTATQLTQLTSQLTDRISSLEKGQYEGIGKGRIADPALAELVAEVKRMSEARAIQVGSSHGMRDMYGWIFGGLVGVIGIIAALFAMFQK